MAKKKKKKRRPIAPPVHSAPEAASHPTGPQPQSTPPARPMGAEPPAPVAAPPRRKTQAQRKSSKALRTKQSKSRQWIVIGVVAIAAIAAIAGSKMTANKTTVTFAKVAASGSCGKVQTITGLTNAHRPGEVIKYKTSPPAGGDHYPSTISAGVYDKPFSTNTSDPHAVYLAVHSLEHGAVIVWYDGLSSKQRNELSDHFDGESKVIVVPYPGLKDGNHIALSAWSKLDYCKRVSTKAIDAFVEQYRDATTAPERFYPI